MKDFQFICMCTTQSTALTLILMAAFLSVEGQAAVLLALADQNVAKPIFRLALSLLFFNFSYNSECDDNNKNKTFWNKQLN